MDKAVEKTHDIYSVRNTTEPLTLKARHVPCLCLPCITENGECLNQSHTDPWKLVHLKPEKGANLRKYQKRKRPDSNYVPRQTVAEGNGFGNQLHENEIVQMAGERRDEQLPNLSSDDKLPDIVFEPKSRKQKSKNGKSKDINLEKKEKKKKGETDNETDTVTDTLDLLCRWVNYAEEINPDEFLEALNEIPDKTPIDQDVEIIEVCERRCK